MLRITKDNKALIAKLVAGTPVELTEASPEVVELRRELEGDCLLVWGESEFDLAGCVFWSPDKAAVVFVPSSCRGRG